MEIRKARNLYAPKPVEDVRRPLSSQEVLRTAAQKYRDGLREADEAIDHDRHLAAQFAMLQAGQAVAGIKEGLAGTIDVSFIPADKRKLLAEIADRAGRLIDAADLYSLTMMLYVKGSRIDDPNELEVLIESIYPKDTDIINS
jgi:hypothetical protein